MAFAMLLPFGALLTLRRRSRFASLRILGGLTILLASAVAGRPGDLPENERRRLYARGLYLTTPRAAEVLLDARKNA